MLFPALHLSLQIVLIPMAVVLGKLGLAGSVPGLILVHVVYGIGFTTLYFRNYYASFPTELIRAAQIDGAGSSSASSGASSCRSPVPSPLSA